jgi:hypothetical protein
MDPDAQGARGTRWLAPGPSSKLAEQTAKWWLSPGEKPDAKLPSAVVKPFLTFWSLILVNHAMLNANEGVRR